MDQLVDLSKNNNFPEASPEKKPMSMGNWVLLNRVSVDCLMTMYLQTIPIKVQNLFEKETWSVDDLLDLSPAEDNQRQGIYVDFATGDIKHKRDIGCDAYVGSAMCLHRRWCDHMSYGRQTIAKLPDYRRSFHYLQICKKGVRAKMVIPFTH